MLIKRSHKDKFGYEIITFSFDNEDSYFQFLYTPQLNNIEKTVYKTKDIEELYIFLQELNKFVDKLSIRYVECFVSAYEPSHQKLFYDSGFSPRGYVPSWNFNDDKNIFEDYIVFNYFKGKIDKKIQLIPESMDLLHALNEMQTLK